jgi:hypothetical protein
MWCDEKIEQKRKLRYYKDVINSNLEKQNFLFVFPSVKKKIRTAKIRLGIGQFLKCDGMKEGVTFVTLRRLKMKITLS